MRLVLQTTTLTTQTLRSQSPFINTMQTQTNPTTTTKPSSSNISRTKIWNWTTWRNSSTPKLKKRSRLASSRSRRSTKTGKHHQQHRIMINKSMSATSASIITIPSSANLTLRPSKLCFISALLCTLINSKCFIRLIRDLTLCTSSYSANCACTIPSLLQSWARCLTSAGQLEKRFCLARSRPRNVTRKCARQPLILVC